MFKEESRGWKTERDVSPPPIKGEDLSKKDEERIEKFGIIDFLSNLYCYPNYICKFLGNVGEEGRRFFKERWGKRIEKFGIINASFRIFIIPVMIFVNFWEMWVKRGEDLSKKDEERIEKFGIIDFLSNLYLSYDICKFLGNVDEERRRSFEERWEEWIEKFGIIDAFFRIFIVIPVTIFVNFWEMWVKRGEDFSKKNEGNE